jgi:pimeloyl-ACP methyl ester carboxylesterase
MCWFRTLDVFAEAGYHVFAPDNVGAAYTQVLAGDAVPLPPDSRRPSPAFIGAFMDGVGVSQAHFIGNSGGSMATTPFVAANPDRVLSFITSGGEPRLSTERASAIAPRLGRTARMDFVRAMLSKPEVSFEDLREATADFFYDRDLAVIDEVTEMRLALLRDPAVQERERKAAFLQLEGGRQNIDNSIFSRIAAPTYLLHGRDERYFYAAEDWPDLLEAAFLASTVIPTCDSTFLAQCGHWPQLEMPDRYNALCIEFLRAVDKAKS